MKPDARIMSKELSVYYSPLVLHHPTGAGVFEAPTSPLFEVDEPHPENAQRIANMRSVLRKGPIAGLIDWIEAPSATLDQMLRFHDAAYLESLTGIPEGETRRVTSSTVFGPGSWPAVEAAAGQAIAAVDHVWREKGGLAYALVRPPGHHATLNQAMGFCLINNIAVAAEHLLQTQIAERLAIIDIDLHHGNGTQDIFYSRGEVFYFSTHQYPLYPGTGALDEIGTGAGEGRTVNIPLPPYSGNQAFTSCLHSVIFPLLDKFKPQMLLISAGFDAHWRDPLGNLLVSTNCYGEVVAALSDWADINCQGRIALFLEGGYDLEAGAQTALASSRALLGQPWDDPLGNSPTQEESGWQDTLEQAKVIWDL